MNFPVFISKYIEEALTKAGFASVDALSQIKVSADSKFGDYQFNGPGISILISFVSSVFKKRLL